MKYKAANKTRWAMKTSIPPAKFHIARRTPRTWMKDTETRQLRRVNARPPANSELSEKQSCEFPTPESMMAQLVMLIHRRALIKSACGEAPAAYLMRRTIS